MKDQLVTRLRAAFASDASKMTIDPVESLEAKHVHANQQVSDVPFLFVCNSEDLFYV